MIADAAAPSDQQSRHSDVRVVVVDDISANVDLLERLLAKGGIGEIVGFTDPMAALEACTTDPPSLILLDLHMPGLDGVTFLERLRAAIGRRGFVPVIVITADIDSEIRKRALAAGANDFLTKPFDASEVLLRARNMLDVSQLYAEFRELDALKSQTFANVSHELRTPLALMLGPTKRLQGLLGAEYQHDLALIEDNARLVLKHITDLLDAAKLEAHAVAARYRRGSLGALIQKSAELFGRAADSRGLSLDVDGLDDLQIETDLDHVRRILINLIGNAIRFTPASGRIVIGYRREGECAVITVDDSGPGIAPAEREVVFERFRQLQTGLARRTGGTGLGLAISRELATLMHGTVSMDASPLGGARAVLTLPLYAPEGISVDTASPTESHPIEQAALDAAGREEPKNAITLERSDRPNDATVLVCEDNPQLGAFLVEVLAERYNVVAVTDGALGLTRARQNPPDLIVTDIMMPGMSGDQLITELQRDPELSDVPVLVLSARDGDELRAQLLEHGAKDYMNKPFSQRELLIRAENLIAMRRYTQSLEALVTERTSQLSETQRRIACELNDTVIKSIFRASLSLSGVETYAQDPALLRTVRSAVDEMDEAIRQIRGSVFGSPSDS